MFPPVMSNIFYFLILLRIHTCNRMSFCLTYHCLTDLCCYDSARVFDFGSDDDDAPLLGGNACQYLYFFTSKASKLPSKLPSKLVPFLREQKEQGQELQLEHDGVLLSHRERVVVRELRRILSAGVALICIFSKSYSI